MKKELMERVNKYCSKSMNTYNEKVYFSKQVPDARYKNYRYFLKYHNTHNVAEAFKTQAELEAFLDEREELK